MTPDQISQAVRAALVDMLDCAESATERDLFVGFALNVFEQCQERQPSDVFARQIATVRDQLSNALPIPSHPIDGAPATIEEAFAVG